MFLRKTNEQISTKYVMVRYNINTLPGKDDMSERRPVL